MIKDVKIQSSAPITMQVFKRLRQKLAKKEVKIIKLKDEIDYLKNQLKEEKEHTNLWFNKLNEAEEKIKRLTEK